jgi:hypothetical protein
MLGRHQESSLETVRGLPSPTFVQTLAYWTDSLNLETLDDAPILSKFLSRVSAAIESKRPTFRQLISGIFAVFTTLQNSPSNAALMNDESVLVQVSFLVNASKAQYMAPADPLEAEHLINAVIRTLQKELCEWNSNAEELDQINALEKANPWVIGLCYFLLARFAAFLDCKTERWNTQMSLVHSAPMDGLID